MRTVAIVVLTLVLHGCVQADRSVPSAVPPRAPLFATDTEALTSAVEAYAAYRTALDDAFMSYDTSKLVTVAGGEALEAAHKAVALFEAAGKHQLGRGKVNAISAADLSPWTGSGDATQISQIYTCLDVSGVDVTGHDGLSVVDVDRASNYPQLVSLKWMPDSHAMFIVEEELWGGQNFCD